MDCCSKYPDYRHHPMNGIIGGSGHSGNGNSIGNGYYSHPHPSLRYQQSMYRLGVPTGYNGIGPPPPSPSQTHATNLYPNYDRYSSYPNLPPYAYSNPNFNYGHLNMSGYYNHYENYNRLGGFSYHNYRDMYENSGLQRNGNAYLPIYGHSSTGREYHQGGNLFHHNPHTHNHHHHHHHQQQHHNPSKESFISQMSDIERVSDGNSISNNGSGGDNENVGCADSGSVNNISTFNSEITTTSSPLTKVCGSNNGCTNNPGGGLMHLEFSSSTTSSGTSYLSNGNILNSSNAIQQQQQQQQQQQHQHQIHPSSAHMTQQHSTRFPYGNKETKSRKSFRDKDKNSGRLSVNRKLDCSTSLDTTNLDNRSATPFPSHQNRYVNSPARLQNGYLSSNQSHNNWSPTQYSSQNWSPQFSPKSNRKRVYSSPQPQESPMQQPTLFVNKNRILECDFIPSKKSRRKIKTETAEETFEYREEIKNITPLPGFQQAFGSTEIGRFSETFFNITPESPIEPPYESEADTLSPQPWEETGDSLEGPHFNLHIGASVQPVYSENHNSMDSPVESNYFSEIGCSDY